MWICLAIFAFSSRRWAAREWFAGGVCLGLAFGTHMGAGAPIFGIGAAVAVSAIFAGSSPSLAARERLRRLVACPLVGAAGAALPLLLLEGWARLAGDTYLGRLRHHENLNYAGVGPFGLWIRQLFELDPMIEVIVILLLIGAVGRLHSRRRKRAARLAVLLFTGLILLSLRDAPPRAIVSLALFAAIAAAISLFAGRDTPTPSRPGSSELFAGAAPFSARSAFLAAAVTAFVLIFWRSVSCMPRLTFAAWPLFALALTGEVAKRFGPRPGAGARVLRPLAGLACILAVLGAFAVLRLRDIEARASAAASRHPAWVRLIYEDLWAYDDRQRASGWLATRANFDADVIAPPAQLYPIAAYEEEPYKLLLFRDTVREFQLAGTVSWLEAPWAVFFFDPGPTVPANVAAARHPLTVSR